MAPTDSMVRKWTDAGYEHDEFGTYGEAASRMPWDHDYALVPVGAVVGADDDLLTVMGRWVTVSAYYASSIGAKIEPLSYLVRRKVKLEVPPLVEEDEDPQVREHKALARFFKTPAGRWPGFLTEAQKEKKK